MQVLASHPHLEAKGPSNCEPVPVGHQVKSDNWLGREWVLDSSIRQMVNIDKMQFSFVPGRGTTGAIFIIRQLQ